MEPRRLDGSPLDPIELAEAGALPALISTPKGVGSGAQNCALSLIPDVRRLQAQGGARGSRFSSALSGLTPEGASRSQEGRTNKMKRVFAIAALALAALLVVASAASASVGPGTYTDPGFNSANAPTGTHLANSSAT